MNCVYCTVGWQTSTSLAYQSSLDPELLYTSYTLAKHQAFILFCLSFIELIILYIAYMFSDTTFIVQGVRYFKQHLLNSFYDVILVHVEGKREGQHFPYVHRRVLRGIHRNERGGISSRRRFNSLPLAASGDKKVSTSSLQEIEHQRRILSAEMWREKASLTGRMLNANGANTLTIIDQRQDGGARDPRMLIGRPRHLMLMPTLDSDISKRSIFLLNSLFSFTYCFMNIATGRFFVEVNSNWQLVDLLLNSACLVFI